MRHLQKALLLLMALTLFPAWAFAQIQVSGSVVDSANEPLPGVSVKEVGTSNGTVTDVDGLFKITVKSDKAVLEFSYVGYTTKSETVGAKRSFNIVMEETSTMLDNVVVIGYGTMDKKELTSAVSHISGEDMLSVSSIDPAMGLQGKVAGVSVTNTAAGDPNNGASIQIRGVSSRSAGLGPLIVIDGVAGGNLHNLSASDIESIDVLKDGAASAIYGTRGSNGVIVVTTKGGAKDGQVHTNYEGYVSWDFAHSDLKVLDREEYLAAGLGSDYGYDTDWFKEITRTGFAQNHTLTLSGGNQKSNYRITMDTRHATGIDLRSSRREYGGRAQFEHNTKNGLLPVTSAPTVLTGMLSLTLSERTPPCR